MKDYYYLLLYFPLQYFWCFRICFSIKNEESYYFKRIRQRTKVVYIQDNREILYFTWNKDILLKNTVEYLLRQQGFYYNVGSMLQSVTQLSFVAIRTVSWKCSEGHTDRKKKDVGTFQLWSKILEKFDLIKILNFLKEL